VKVFRIRLLEMERSNDIKCGSIEKVIVMADSGNVE
jgi:hypothetical protein